MSFRCEYCGASNNEIQSAGSIRRTSAQLNGHGDAQILFLDSGGYGLYRQSP
jgi:hypothetical protein